MAESFDWISADNVTYPLTVLKDSAGWLMAPYEIGEVYNPSGTTVATVMRKSRDLDLPVLLTATTRAALISAWRTLSTALDPINGQGKIKYTKSDGSSRVLNCLYRQGFEGREALGESLWIKTTLTFHAVDPVWYSESPVTATYVKGVTATFFPFFPIKLAGTSIFATPTVVYNGDIDTYPIWTVTGPAYNIAIKNLTTGKTIDLSIILQVGDVLTIDTRGGIKTIIQDPDINQFSALSTLSSLWPLIKGTNNIQIEIASATAVTSVVLRYYDRYLTA